MEKNNVIKRVFEDKPLLIAILAVLVSLIVISLSIWLYLSQN